MSEPSSANFGFGNLIPGFEFLQNLGKNAPPGMPQMPSMASWVAPTLSVEELDKRIQDLKAVQFWLDQNSRALTATVQALEVQKMTLATLQGMNLSMTDLASAFKTSTADMVQKTRSAVAEPPTPAAHVPAAAAPSTWLQSASLKPSQPTSATAPSTAPAASPAAAPMPGSSAADEPAPAVAKGVVDAVQWWNSLTQQFQQIAQTVITESAKHAPPAGAGAVDAAGRPAAPSKGQAAPAASGPAVAPAHKAPAKPSKPSKPRKPAAKPACPKPPGGG